MADPVGQAVAWTQAMLDAPYLNYKMRSFFKWKSGNLPMGVAAPDGTPAEVVKLEAATGVKAVACIARRQGVKPLLPPREADTSNQVFLWEEFMLETADAEGDAQVTITFGVVRVYFLRTPLSPDNGDSLNFGQPPFLTGAAANNNLTLTDLDPSQIVGAPGDAQRIPHP